MTDESLSNALDNSNKGELLDNKNSKIGVISKHRDLDKLNPRQTIMLEEKIEESGSPDDKGKIEEAKKHRSANRPLHKIKEFNNNVNFCNCCNLPCEEKGIIEPFGFCDNIDKFAECGLGVSLYFYFFRFAIVVVFAAICVMAISMMVFNHHYTKGINRVCNNYFVRKGRNDLIYCEGFITVANESINVYNRFNDWILRFTSDNIYVYRKLHNNITDTTNSENVLINYSVLNFFFLLSIFILNIFYIIFIAAQSQKAKLLNFSIRDYTVLISNAQHILIEYIEQKQKSNFKFTSSIKESQLLVENTSEFISFVNEYIRSDKSLIDLKIKYINMCYNLGSYIELRDEYEKCKEKIFKIKNDPTILKINKEKGQLLDKSCYYSFPLKVKCIKKKGKPLITLEKQKQDLEKQIDFELKNIQIITEQNFTGYMFISFDKIKDKETILKEYPNNFFDLMISLIKNIKFYICCCCVGKGEKKKFNKLRGINVEDPPEPDDLYWENFRYNSSNRVIRILLVFLASLIIIAISFVIVLLFTVWQNKLLDDNKKLNLFVKYLLSFIITIVISVLNLVLERLLTKFTFLERHLSRTNFYLSLSIKLTILTFFNSAIIPLLSKEIGVKKKIGYQFNIDRNNLLVSDIFILFVVNAIATPLLWTFNIPYIINQIRIYLIEKQNNPDESHHMTQRKLNKLYELPDMKIAYKYSYLAKTLAMALFYMPIFPMGFFICLIGFVLGYILEKFNFTHLYKRPEMLDEIITKVYADYFIIILFIAGIGDYFFFHDVFPSPDNKWSLVNIIIFGILIIIPYTKFINCNFVGIEKSEYHNFLLSEIYFTFYSDYQRQNPLTKKAGLINYLTELKNNGYLSNNFFKLAQENIETLNIMEIYYGMIRGNIPIIHQSVMANTNNQSIACKNSRQSLVAPNFKDSNKEKLKKQKFFDSQIMNLFGSKISKKIEAPFNFPMDTIIEEDEEKQDKKNKLINAYNNPFGINFGLGPLPMNESIYKSQPMSKSIKKDSKEVNKYKNDSNIFKDEPIYKSQTKNVNQNNIQDDNYSGSKTNINDNSIDISKEREKKQDSISKYYNNKNENSLSKEKNKNSLSNYIDKNSNEINIPNNYYKEPSNNNSLNISQNFNNLDSITHSEESRKNNMPFNADENDNQKMNEIDNYDRNDSQSMNNDNLKVLFNTSSNNNKTENLIQDINDDINIPLDSVQNNNLYENNDMNNHRVTQSSHYNDTHLNVNPNNNEMPNIPIKDNIRIDLNEFNNSNKDINHNNLSGSFDDNNNDNYI